MTQRTNGMPDLKYSEEAFRDMYEALKELAKAYNVNGEGIRLDDDLVYWQNAIRALAKAEGIDIIK